MKYQIGQKIFYIYQNKAASSLVASRRQVDNRYDDTIPEQAARFQPFGKSGIHYSTSHGIFAEEFVFASKEELLASL